jgi:hypothetical protein
MACYMEPIEDKSVQTENPVDAGSAAAAAPASVLMPKSSDHVVLRLATAASETSASTLAGLDRFRTKANLVRDTLWITIVCVGIFAAAVVLCLTHLHKEMLSLSERFTVDSQYRIAIENRMIELHKTIDAALPVVEASLRGYTSNHTATATRITVELMAQMRWNVILALIGVTIALVIGIILSIYLAFKPGPLSVSTDEPEIRACNVQLMQVFARLQVLEQVTHVHQEESYTR